MIYNPVAGKVRRNPERILQRTIDALASVNLRPGILPTRAVGDATVRAREAVESGADLVIVLGGDGTINEAVNGLVGTSVPLAPLPGGTANCLAVEIGLGKRIASAARKLSECQERQVALGRIVAGESSRCFLLMCGAGLDARIVHDLNSGLKRAAGKIAYWAAGFSQITHAVQPLTAKLRGNVGRCGFLLASRIRNYGGDLEIARGASLLREDFEVVMFEGANPLRYLWYMLGVLSGRVQRMHGVHVAYASEVEIASPAHVQIDGEYAGRGPLKIEIIQDGIRLLMPPQYG